MTVPGGREVERVIVTAEIYSHTANDHCDTDDAALYKCFNRVSHKWELNTHQWVLGLIALFGNAHTSNCVLLSLSELEDI